MLRRAPPPTRAEPSEPGSWIHGWQKPATTSPIASASFAACRRVPELCCAPMPGAHAGEWLRAIPTRAHSSCRWICKLLSGDAFACRYPWRQPVAVDMASQAAEPWGTNWATIAPPALGVGCWPSVLPLERAWVRVAQEAVAAEGRVVPQQWLARTTAPGVAPDYRRRLDLVIYGASWRARALRAAVCARWEGRWWGQLGCTLQRALASTLLGGCWRAPAQPTGDQHTPLGCVLELAEDEQPSRLP